MSLARQEALRVFFSSHQTPDPSRLFGKAEIAIHLTRTERKKRYANFLQLHLTNAPLNDQTIFLNRKKYNGLKYASLYFLVKTITRISYF